MEERIATLPARFLLRASRDPEGAGPPACSFASARLSEREGSRGTVGSRLQDHAKRAEKNSD